jgi:hypothetical protein
LIADAVRRAEAEVADMQTVEENTDAEVAEVKASAGPMPASKWHRATAAFPRLLAGH